MQSFSFCAYNAMDWKFFEENISVSMPKTIPLTISIPTY